VDGRRQRFETEAVVHLKAVYNAAYRLARHQGDAEDLTQDTMLRAYRSFDSFEPGTNARAWLLKILYSIFVNGYHRRRRMPVHVAIEDLELKYGQELRSPEVVTPDPFRGPWSEPEVEAALAKVPEDFRMAVLLVDVEDLTYEEAARALGCEIGTVRSRLFRARRILAALLAEFASERGLLRGKVEPT
jgi:RNA polymerase sigma-70 factor (ECF subfamily)